MKARMLVALNEKVRKGHEAPAHLATKLVRVRLAEPIVEEVSEDMLKRDLVLAAEAKGIEVKPKDSKKTLVRKIKAAS